MEGFVKSLLYSTLHAAVSATAGSVIDPFFAARPDESIVETTLWTGAHTAANGLAFSLIQKAVFPTDTVTIGDPTGGAFLAFPFFIVQANYINRLRKLGSGLQNIVTGMIRTNLQKETATNQPEAPTAQGTFKFASFAGR